MCTGEEKLSLEDTEFEGQLQYVSDAVMAFAYAFKLVHLTYRIFPNFHNFNLYYNLNKNLYL